MKNFVQNGDRITFAASALTGPNNPIKGSDPVVTTSGRICGVAVADAVPGAAGPANDSNVVVQLKGVFQLSVQSTHHAIGIGQTVYINGSTGVLSDDLTQIPYGAACDAVSQYATTSIRVRLFGSTFGAVGADS
jgi:predicted RecA/RadA family phage recombinase